MTNPSALTLAGAVDMLCESLAFIFDGHHILSSKNVMKVIPKVAVYASTKLARKWVSTSRHFMVLIESHWCKVLGPTARDPSECLWSLVQESEYWGHLICSCHVDISVSVALRVVVVAFLYGVSAVLVGHFREVAHDSFLRVVRSEVGCGWTYRSCEIACQALDLAWPLSKTGAAEYR